MFQRSIVSKEEAILTINGSLSSDTANEFQNHLQELEGGGYQRIVLDLSNVTTVNSSSLGKMLLFRKKLSEQGRTLVIRGCNEALYKTLQMIKIDKLIQIER